jgi:hypothetical protein
MRVEVFGLLMSVEFNGRCGKILGYSKDHDRWSVQLDPGNEGEQTSKLLPAGNLRVADSSGNRETGRVLRVGVTGREARVIARHLKGFLLRGETGEMDLEPAAGLEMADFMRRNGDAALCTEMIAHIAGAAQQTYLPT